MDVGQRARNLKHAGFVMYKRTRWAWRARKFALATGLFAKADRLHPYRYDANRYRGTFLDLSLDAEGESALPRHVFVLWTGDNPMSDARARNLGLLKSRIGLPVHLVTENNLDQWLVTGHPLHPAYEHLSFVHRSDYLRGYLMHHHGGAYADVKEPLGSWHESFDRFAADLNGWVVSYPTTHANWIGKLRGRLGRDILVRYGLMFGKGAFIMRSHTSLTAEWLAEMNRRLDAAGDALARCDGGAYGGGDYPLSWTDLLGRVLDPLTLKHLEHVRYDSRLLLDFVDYR